MARRVVKAITSGMMDHHTMVSGITTALMDRELTSGTTEESTLATGSTTACMEKVSTLGKMAEATKASMLKTKSTEEASTPGPMAERMTEPGVMESSTATANTSTLTLVKLNAADGKTESAWSGIRTDDFETFRKRSLLISVIQVTQNLI